MRCCATVRHPRLQRGLLNKKPATTNKPRPVNICFSFINCTFLGAFYSSRLTKSKIILDEQKTNTVLCHAWTRGASACWQLWRESWWRDT